MSAIKNFDEKALALKELVSSVLAESQSDHWGATPEADRLESVLRTSDALSVLAELLGAAESASAPYITRRAIHASEEVEEAASSIAATAYSWTAKLDGWLSRGEHVEMTRSGATFTEAVGALEDAIVKNGWKIKEKGTR